MFVFVLFFEKRVLLKAVKTAIDFDDFFKEKIYYACIVFFIKKT